PILKYQYEQKQSDAISPDKILVSCLQSLFEIVNEYGLWGQHTSSSTSVFAGIIIVIFNRADEALRMRFRVRRPIRRLDDADPRVLEAGAECLTPPRVPVADHDANHAMVGHCDGPRDLAHERSVMRRRSE